MNWSFKTRRGKLDLRRVRAVWSRFARYVRPHRLKLLGAFAASFGVIAMQVAAPWPIKVIFDDILFHKPKMASSWIGHFLSRFSDGPTTVLAWVCAAILLFAVLDAVFAHVRDVLLAKSGQRIVGRIRHDLFKHLQTLSPAVFERRPAGDLLLRLTGDIQMLRQMLVNAVINAGQSSLVVLAMIAAMFWLNPLLAALAIATIPIALAATWRTTEQIRKATGQQRERESEVASLAHDVLGAISVVQAFNREEIEHERFARQNRSAVRAGVRTTRLESKLYRVISVASALGVCTILYVGVRAVLADTMTAGDLLVFLSYLRSMNKPMRNLAKLSGQVAKATACGQRVAELFAIQPEVEDRPGAIELKDIRGGISLDQVSYHYQDGPPVLLDLSLQIQPRERIAIVGHTGAGKTTLAKLLLRFADPQTGAVRIDGTDIRDVTLESLRRRIGWVHQDTVLFGMTVAENISLGCPGADPDEVRAVARQVHADGFIEKLPAGYETVLGQDGLTLSGGQRQRLALARALLRRPRILILDEPVTGLDTRTRQLVERTWMSPQNRATTLVICHRLQAMERFDRIVLLRQGRICEVGTHRELLAAGGEYAALYSAGRDDIVCRPEREELAC